MLNALLDILTDEEHQEEKGRDWVQARGVTDITSSRQDYRA